MLNPFYLQGSFLQFKKFLITKNTGNHFCLLFVLQSEMIIKKAIISGYTMYSIKLSMFKPLHKNCAIFMKYNTLLRRQAYFLKYTPICYYRCIHYFIWKNKMKIHVHVFVYPVVHNKVDISAYWTRVVGQKNSFMLQERNVKKVYTKWWEF